MAKSFWLTAIVAGCAVAAVQPATALDGCKIGQRVKAPGGKIATVTAVAGSGCTVRADGEPFTNTYAAFMLDPAPGAVAAAAPKAVAAAAGPANGLYQRTSGAAGNLKLRIIGGGRYSNDTGSTGTYTLSAGRMAFKGGPWDGFYGAALAGGRIGLTASATGTFYQMTCDRRGN